MPLDSLEEQLLKYLTDAHSIERQALVQMRAAPRLAGDDRIAQAFSDHLRETEEHELLIRKRLEVAGAKPSMLKDALGTLTGIGFGAFAAAQPDTPGKLVAHAFSYEHMEQAAYDLLGKVAQRAGDDATVATAWQIEQQEQSMAERLSNLFDVAVDASLKQSDPDYLAKQVSTYLADAHAIEEQSIQLLSKAPDIVGSGQLARAFEEHLNETEQHERLFDSLLEGRGESRSKIRDAALRLGAINWSAFFGAQPDTPAKLTGFAYAFEHLEIASYELLKRVATRAGDHEVVDTAERILVQEREAADRLRGLFDEAVETTLSTRGLS